MPSASEVKLFLSSYDKSTIDQAHLLVESKRVRLSTFTKDRVQAKVHFEDSEVVVTLIKRGNIWTPDPANKNGINSSIAEVASLLEAEVQDRACAEEALEDKSLQEQAEDVLKRSLNASEEQFLSKVEKRYERFQSTGELLDHDMVRIHSRWPIQSYEPLKLWPKKPRNILEFWNYIAAALLERKLTYPSFLECITKLEETQAQLQAWHQQEDLPKWRNLIRSHVHQSAPALQSAELRLMITNNEVKFQASDGTSWHSLTEAELDRYLELDHEHALQLPLTSRLILLSASHWLPSAMHASIRLEDSNTTRWLCSLFQQSELNAHLVTLDEQPFRRVSSHLRWDVAEKTNDQGELSSIELDLVTDSSEEVPKGLRYLPGLKPLYLSADIIFEGPEWFMETSEVSTPISIPVAALNSEDGIRFFEKIGADLPPTLASRTSKAHFKLNIQAKCLPKPEKGSTEHVVFEITAKSSNQLIEQKLRGKNWEVTDFQPPHPLQIPIYNRDCLDVAESLMENIKASYDPELDAFRTRVTKVFPEQFFQWSNNLPENCDLEPDRRLQSILADPLKATVRLEVSETSMDWFDLKLIFDIEGLDLKPAEIRKLIAAKGGFVRLADGTWRSVKLELTPEQEEAVAALGLDINELSDEAHPIHARQLAMQEKKGLIPTDVWEKLQNRLATLDLQTKPEVPNELTATLRPYQLEGFHFLVYLTVNHLGGILADDMGLGKTMQSIAWVLWLHSNAKTKTTKSAPALVVCPKSVLDVWAIEFGKAAPNLKVQVLREKDTLDLKEVVSSADVLVLNYAQLRSCIEDLTKIEWLCVILDEGQHIKNPDSKVAKAARQLSSKNRLVLTGTPLENRLLDLWSLMTFATPGALGERNYFQKHFDRRKDELAASRLSARLRPFILRRTKQQVAKDLPPRTEENLLCEMSGIQEKLYRDQLANAQHMIITATGADLLNKRRFAILQAITRLRQICCHPALAGSDSTQAESAKLNTLLELLDQLHEEGHKVLVFSQFVSMLEIIRNKLIELNRPYHWLTGSSQNRAQIVQDFQEDPEASVFLLSLKAGGSGLNLTAASYVILYDPWWNPAVENQAIDRAHRIGQTQPVMAYRLLAKGTIEEKIQKLKEQKQMLSDDILGGESFARSLEKADLEYLFDLKDSPSE